MNIVKRMIYVIIVSCIFAYRHLRNIFRARPAKMAKKTRPFKWYKVPLGKECVSSDGSKYVMYVNKGTSDNLLIYFSGGGIAWDPMAVHNPMGLKSFLRGKGIGFYFSRLPVFGSHPMKGALQNNNRDNPFYGWNIAYIPYTTGDFHIGNKTAEIEYEGKTKKMHFNGLVNAKKALEKTYSIFKSAKNVFVCGESAGAFGSAFYLNEIASKYPDSSMYYLSDNAHLRYDQWDKTADFWGTDAKEEFGFSLGGDIVKASFINSSKALGAGITLLHANTLRDAVLTRIYANMNGISTETTDYIDMWSRQMTECTKDLSEAIPNYYYYITNNEYDAKTHMTPHVISRHDRFYKYKQDDVFFYKWIGDILDGKKYSVGEKYIKQQMK